MDSWAAFKNMMKARKEKQTCLHKARHTSMVIGDIELCCCDSPAITCKKTEAAFLLDCLRELCGQKDMLTLENDLLKQNQKGNIKTNTVNYNNCNFTVDQINVLNASALEIANDAIQGNNVYDSAIKRIQNCPNSYQKQELLRKAYSNIAEEKLDFRISVVNAIEEEAKKMENNEFKATVLGGVERTYKELAQEGQNLGLEMSMEVVD